MTKLDLEPLSLDGGLTEDPEQTPPTGSSRAPGRAPTAIAAFNDRCALGLLQALTRRGLRVPEEMSVAGFDDITAAGSGRIDLTTIRQDTDRLGQLAVDRLRHRPEEGAPPASAGVVPPTLAVRGTTAPPGVRA